MLTKDLRFKPQNTSYFHNGGWNRRMKCLVGQWDSSSILFVVNLQRMSEILPSLESRLNLTMFLLR